MRLTEGVEWAAHCAALLAALPPGTALPASRLAEFHGVPGPYLSKSLQALGRAGIVESVPGRRGGFRLARPAGAITLLDVVTAVEGPERAFRCTEIRRRGPAAVARRFYSPRCAIAAAMWEAEDAWRERLADTTIADIAAAVAQTAPTQSQAKARRWFAQIAPDNPAAPG